MSDSPAAVPLNFYRALQQKDYVRAWGLLTSHSQTMIIEILARSWKAQSADELRSAFDRGQGVAKSYWDVFRTSVKLQQWLSQTYRPFGVSGNEVIVKASPAKVTMLVINEGGHWKFGYMETFGS